LTKPKIICFMKKSILAVAVILGSTAFAQKMESKHGEAYLPAAEDWAISIDANPFLNYFGNFIGGNGTNTAPSWNYLTNNQTIYGKYFAADDMAYRAGIRLGFGSTKGSAMVTDRGADPSLIQYPSNLPAQVENTWKSGYTNIGIMVGLEKRRGFGRLQGFYGAELGIALSSSKNTFTYGNAYNSNATFNISASTDDDMDVNGDAVVDNSGTDPFGNGGRITEWKSGSAFGIGLRGFIGAEYFVLPRLAVGGEFGWGFAFLANGTGSATIETEGIDSGGNEVQSTFTTETKNGSRLGIDTEAMNSVFGPAGRLKITFHF
jgi:hypothetical protein